MRNDRKPIAKLTFRKDNETYSILTIWPGKFPGTYDVSRDKERTSGQGKLFPAMGLFDALKSWGMGVGFLSISVESEREPRSAEQKSGGQYDRPPAKTGDDFGGGGDFGGDDIPFAPFDERRC